MRAVGPVAALTGPAEAEGAGDTGAPELLTAGLPDANTTGLPDANSAGLPETLATGLLEVTTGGGVVLDTLGVGPTGGAEEHETVHRAWHAAPTISNRVSLFPQLFAVIGLSSLCNCLMRSSVHSMDPWPHSASIRRGPVLFLPFPPRQGSGRGGSEYGLP